MSTYTRTAFQVLQDALVKHRVLKGIAALEEKYGPDWADKIDLETLDLSCPSSCVLGQLYGDATVDDDVVEHWRHTERANDRLGYTIDEPGGDVEFEAAANWLRNQEGFEKGLAILDGPLLDHDGDHLFGFDKHYMAFSDLLGMTDEQLADLGVTRQMVEDARTTIGEVQSYVVTRYDLLNIEWEQRIMERRRDA